MRKLTKDEAKEIFMDAAKEAAKEVCGIGECHACYNCGHTNKNSFILDKLGKGDRCPLEPFNITPDKRSFSERLKAGDCKPVQPVEDQLGALSTICACCDHSVVKETKKDFKMDADFEAYCIDCPVNMAREGLIEAAAEAAAMG